MRHPDTRRSASPPSPHPILSSPQKYPPSHRPLPLHRGPAPASRSWPGLSANSQTAGLPPTTSATSTHHHMSAESACSGKESGSPDQQHTTPQLRPPSAQQNSTPRSWSEKASLPETHSSAATHHTASTDSRPYGSSPCSLVQIPHAPSDTSQKTEPRSSSGTAPPHPHRNSPPQDSTSGDSTRHDSMAPAPETRHAPCHAAPARRTPPADPTYPPGPTSHPPPASAPLPS